MGEKTMKYKDKEMIFHVYECSDGTIMIREKTGELVRCGECKHRDPEDKRCDCGGHEWVKGKILPVEDDWFCADGERKDGEG